MTGSGYEVEAMAGTGSAGAAGSTAAPALDVHPAFRRDKFLLHQKRLAISEKYFVFDERGEQIMFVRREAHHLRQVLAFLAALVSFAIVITPAMFVVGLIDQGFGRRNSDVLEIAVALAGLVLAMIAAIVVGVWLAPKRHIGFFGDASLSVPLLTVFQDQKFAFFIKTYTVADPELTMIGLCRKNYLHNIIRKKWECYGPAGEVLAIVREDSIIESILRRLLGPMLGVLRANYRIYAPDGRTEIGAFNRKFTLFDKYVLDMTKDGARRALDRRMAVAIGVLLDTGERR